MRKTRKITYSAVGAAISAICVFLTNFGWLKVSLLMAAALCYYVIFVKCGPLYGFMDIAVSMLITFFAFGTTPLSSAFLLTALVFAPYAFLCYCIRPLHYTRWQTALLRIVCIIAFANLSLCGVWFTAEWIFDGLVTQLAGRVGGYAVLALLFTVCALLFDFLFNQLSIRVCRSLR